MTRRMNKVFLNIGGGALAVFVVAGFTALFLFRSRGAVFDVATTITFWSAMAAFVFGLVLGLVPLFYTHSIRTWRKRAGELGPLRHAHMRLTARSMIGAGMTVHEGGGTKWDLMDGWTPSKAPRSFFDPRS